MKKRILQMFLSGLLVLFSASLFAQTEVSGVVKSVTGELLPGVTVPDYL